MAYAASLRAHLASRRGLPPKLVEGYASWWEREGATHELTISLGMHPRSFDPETEFIPQLRKVVREITRVVKKIPRRRIMSVGPTDAAFMAGFYEARDASGMLFPHFHGVVALGPYDEWAVRQRLIEEVGQDMTDGSAMAHLMAPGRTCINLPGAKPTFHLKPLSGAGGVRRYIRYAGKQVVGRDPVHWTTADILHRH